MAHPGINGEQRQALRTFEPLGKHSLHELKQIRRGRVTRTEGELIIGGKTWSVELARRGQRIDRRGIPLEDRRTKRPNNWKAVNPEDFEHVQDLVVNVIGQRFHPTRVTFGPEKEVTLADFPGGAKLLALK